MVERIALEHHVTVDELGEQVQGAGAAARGAVFLHLRQTTHLTSTQIGRIFGCDHTSVLYGAKKAGARRPRRLAPRDLLAVLRVI
jgi:chromosomal replication initiation ATPase DnaA